MGKIQRRIKRRYWKGGDMIIEVLKGILVGIAFTIATFTAIWVIYLIYKGLVEVIRESKKEKYIKGRVLV